jgi:hypothetical protein
MATSDSARLACALSLVERVLAAQPASQAPSPATPAEQALRICLSSAAALIEVGQVLSRKQHSGSTDALILEWQALIAHTKQASRSAHQAAVLLADQRHIMSAQQRVILSGNAHARRETV